MPILKKLVGQNLVIVAKNFNPTIIGENWLVKKEIIQASDKQPGSIFSDVVSQLQTAEFSLTVMPEQLLFNPVSLESQPLVTSKIGKIVEELKETPFNALGMNFIWHVNSTDKSIEDFSRQLFYNESIGIAKKLSAPNTKFGYYVSAEVLGFRLKLEVKPVDVTSPTGKSSQIQFAFNYHRDLTQDDKAREIIALLPKWQECYVYANALIQEISQ